MNRRSYMGLLSMVVLPTATQDRSTTCPVCQKTCVGEASSRAVKKWEKTHSRATVCYDASESNLYVHEYE